MSAGLRVAKWLELGDVKAIGDKKCSLIYL